MTSKRDTLRARTRQSIDPDAPASAPPVAPAPLRTVQAPEPAERPVEAPEAAPTPAQGPAVRKPAAEKSASQQQQQSSSPADWRTALDDPNVVAGKREYTSFYVPKELKARFAAAIYWTARHPKAAGQVPLSMSSAVTEYMETLATDLEGRFNEGEVFPPTPEQIKAADKRRPAK